MGKRVKIEVTAGDIRRGVKGFCEKCPVALAARRAGIARAWVGWRYISDQGTTRYRMPERAREFVARFDSQLKSKTKPITFYAVPV